MLHIFDHIYKTGGTSFSLSYLLGAINLDAFDPSEVFIVGGHLDKNREDLRRLKSLPGCDKRRLKVIAGHNTGCLRSTFPDARFITLVRNPVERVISGYLHAKYHEDAKNLVGREIEDGNVSLSEFVRSDLFARRYADFVSVRNWQARVLLGSEADAGADPNSMTARIRSRFYLVGYTEALELFLFLLHLTDGFPLLLFNNRLVRKERDSFEPTAECLEVVESFNRLDAAVYHCARQEFDRRLSEVWTEANASAFREYMSALERFRRETGGDENTTSLFSKARLGPVRAGLN